MPKFDQPFNFDELPSDARVEIGFEPAGRGKQEVFVRFLDRQSGETLSEHRKVCPNKTAAKKLCKEAAAIIRSVFDVENECARIVKQRQN